MAIDFNNPASVIAAYNAQYADIDQGPSGICVAADWAAAMMGTSLFVYKTPLPQLSAPFAYYMASHDDTFSGGFDPLAMGAKLQESGICTDALYPTAKWLSNWQNRGSYRPQDLPGPECYADARTRLLLRLGWIRMSTTIPGAADVDEMVNLLRNGYPIVYGTYSHSMCVIAVSPDNYWFYAKDSELANQDLYGAGRGIRILSRDSFHWTPFYAQEVQIPSVTVVPPVVVVPPAGGPLATQADVIAAIHTVGPWDAATYARLQAAVTAAAPVVVPPVITPPVIPPVVPPTSGPTTMVFTNLQSSLNDVNGVRFTWGEYLNPKSGARVLVNGQAQLAAQSCTLVNGQVRCYDFGYGSWRQYPGWVVVPAP